MLTPQTHRWERMALATGWNPEHRNLKALSLALALRDPDLLAFDLSLEPDTSAAG